MQRLLERMARIDQMERGKLCRMGSGSHFNHQTWQDSRNNVRYIPVEQAPFMEKAIGGYVLFMKLAGQYADEVIKQTRREQKRVFPNSKRKR